jgi:hypothetical protein
MTGNASTECPVEAVFPDQRLPCLLERGHDGPHRYTPESCPDCGCIPSDTWACGCSNEDCPCSEAEDEECE